MSHYQKPPELYDGLRLHQNENTGGCSPRVIEALARLRPDQIGFYPPYAAATEAVARYLGVAIEQITLVNGLDGQDVYFAHSFAVEPADDDVVIAATDHDGRIVAAVERGPSEGARSGSKESSSRPCIPPSEAARCASTGDHQAPSPPLFQTSTKGNGQGCP